MRNFYVVFLMLIALTSCLSNSAQNSKGSQTIPVADFQKMLNETKNVQLVDVRTPEEFAEGHLVNAINIDYNAPDFKTKIDALDKTKPTMIYCLSGGRSGGALSYMASSGFANVTNMKGGIMQWRSANLPLNNSSNQTANAQPTWKGMTKEEYSNLISGPVPVVVDFNAKWCGPCKKLKPILEQIQSEYQGKIKIVAIDVDENESLAQSMFVNNIPLIIYHENGKVVSNQEGELDKDGLLKMFKLKS